MSDEHDARRAFEQPVVPSAPIGFQRIDPAEIVTLRERATVWIPAPKDAVAIELYSSDDPAEKPRCVGRAELGGANGFSVIIPRFEVKFIVERAGRRTERHGGDAED